MGNIKSLGSSVLVACSSYHGCSGQVFGDGREVVRGKQLRRDKKLFHGMKDVKRVDKPLPGLKVEVYVVFSEVSE